MQVLSDLPVRSIIADISLFWLILSRHIYPIVVKVILPSIIPVPPPLADDTEDNLQMTAHINRNFPHVLDGRCDRD